MFAVSNAQSLPANILFMTRSNCLTTNFLWRVSAVGYDCLQPSARMGSGNPSVVRVWTGKKVPFSSRPIQKPDPQLLDGPNPYLYPSTRGLCWDWLDLSVPISGSSFLVFFIYGSIQIPCCHVQNINFGTSLSLFVLLVAFIIKTSRDMLPATS